MRSERERAKNRGWFWAARPQSMIYYFILDSNTIMVVRLYPQIQSYKLIFLREKGYEFWLFYCQRVEIEHHKRARYKFAVYQLSSIQKQNLQKSLVFPNFNYPAQNICFP